MQGLLTYIHSKVLFLATLPSISFLRILLLFLCTPVSINLCESQKVGTFGGLWIKRMRPILSGA